MDFSKIEDKELLELYEQVEQLNSTGVTNEQP